VPDISTTRNHRDSVVCDNDRLDNIYNEKTRKLNSENMTGEHEKRSTKGSILDFIESRVDDSRLDGVDGGSSVTWATTVVGGDALSAVRVFLDTPARVRLSMDRGETVLAHFDYCVYCASRIDVEI